MSECPAAPAADELFVKSFVRKLTFNVPDVCGRDSALEEAEREIDEIASTENFDESVLLHCSDAMV
jgi:hypothetical protein